MTTTERGGRETLFRMLNSASESGIDDLSRANRARVAVETAEDIGTLIGLTNCVFPGRGITAIRAARTPVDEKSKALVDLHSRMEQFSTPTLRRALSDFSGLPATDGRIPALGSPFNSAPLMTNAEPLQTVHAKVGAAIVPGLPPNAEGKVNADDYSLDQVIDIVNVGAIPDMAATSIPTSGDVLDFIDEAGEAYLDQLVEDMVNRAAERHIGSQLVAAAGIPTAAGSDLAGALDNAEGVVAAAAQSGCGQLVVNPKDWPKVRRAVAQTWTVDPHPIPAVSVAAPEGTVLMVGNGILRVEASQLSYFGGNVSTNKVYEPALNAYYMSVYRYFRAIIRSDAGVAAVQL